MKQDDRSTGGSASSLLILGTAAVGAAAGMLLAPDSGRKTRLFIRDRFVRAAKRGVRLAARSVQDLRNRLQGIHYEITNRMTLEPGAGDTAGG